MIECRARVERKHKKKDQTNRNLCYKSRNDYHDEICMQKKKKAIKCRRRMKKEKNMKNFE